MIDSTIVDSYYDKQEFYQEGTEEYLGCKGTCRFCGKQANNVKFSNKSHSFSEFLGNKTYISQDECDCCNKEFSKFENDFAQWFKMSLIMGLVDGKTGVPNISQKDSLGNEFFRVDTQNKTTTIKMTGNDQYPIDYQEKRENSEIIVNFHFGKSSLILQNIYKSLVKYAVAFMDEAQVKNCVNAIKWLLGEKLLNHLPLVVLRPTIEKNVPFLKLYTRKETSDKSLPYIVGELGLVLDTFFFVIPETDKDEKGVSRNVLCSKVFTGTSCGQVRDFSCVTKEPHKNRLVFHLPDDRKKLIQEVTTDKITDMTIEIDHSTRKIKFCANKKFHREIGISKYDKRKSKIPNICHRCSYYKV